MSEVRAGVKLIFLGQSPAETVPFANADLPQCGVSYQTVLSPAVLRSGTRCERIAETTTHT
jgi:hypothetical protein